MNARWPILLSTLVCAAAQARTTSYVIAIGNNAPPVHDGAGSPVLRYADDDAVRVYQFFGRFADEARLLSTLDEQTRRRYPQLAGFAQSPSLEALASTVRRLSVQVKADLQRGDQPVVFVSFSGHGGQSPEGEPFLALADGELTRTKLQADVLAPLSGALVHLFIDACNAEGLVGSRGLFEREANGHASPVTDGDARRLAEAAGAGFPRLGILVATTASQESYEWSQIESGVFTHELLSGLAGAADVNGDGVVEYGEIGAFLAAANRDVQDPRARTQVVARPPTTDPRCPIVSLSPLREVAFLVGDFSPLEHFHIELENGERYLDAHLTSEVPGRIAFPANRQAFLVTGDREALLFAKAGETRTVNALRFQPGGETARGSIEASLRRALFASAYGPTYEKGFSDGRTLAATEGSLGASATASMSHRKSLAVSAWTIAGLSLAASATTAALALQAKQDYDATSIQRAASEARDRFAHYRTAAILTGAGALGAGLAGYLLWPRSETRVVAAPLWLGDGVGLALRIEQEGGGR
jgi:hypothetical protein